MADVGHSGQFGAVQPRISPFHPGTTPPMQVQQNALIAAALLCGFLRAIAIGS